ncbi:phosphatase PAP2 family protein [Patescibacteria group bacterium]|nr:phosphatase PAP2 family protein [Patescibacteria group bacterium]
MSLVRKIRAFWLKLERYDKFLTAASFLFLAVIGIALIFYQAPYAPDQFFVFAGLVAFVIGKGKKFLRDWTPPILLILAYEYLRTLIPQINPVVHYLPMIDFDKFIFGVPPTIALQHLFYSAGALHWYDYAASFLYYSHFVIPLLVAFAFWLRDRLLFENYVFTIVGVSFVGFLTFLLFPAAPPWLAGLNGFLPPVTHITDIVSRHLLGSLALPTVYAVFKSNPVAAVPSLHMAYATVTAVFLSKKFPKWTPLFVLYSLAMAAGVMYLGEHYFFDVLTGVIGAGLAYWGVHALFRNKAVENLVDLPVEL